MKKPEEVKKGLVEAIEEASWAVERGDAHDLIDAVDNTLASMANALAYIQQLEREKKDLLEERELNDFLRDRVKSLESQVPRWISVEERLPEGEDPVLILVKETEHYGLHKEKSKVYYCQYLAYWDDEEWYTTWCNGCRKITDTANEPNADDYEVTHWMPLPEVPKEDEK